jgi:hypothetical protein
MGHPRAPHAQRAHVDVGFFRLVFVEVPVQQSAAPCRYLLSVAQTILDGLDDSHLALEPQPGCKTAGWSALMRV